jgi:hypothetical protein
MGVSFITSIKNCMVLHLLKFFIENVNTFSYLISKFVTWFLSSLVNWFPIMRRSLETHGMELENVFKEPGVLGYPLSNCVDS